MDKYEKMVVRIIGILIAVLMVSPLLNIDEISTKTYLVSNIIKLEPKLKIKEKEFLLLDRDVLISLIKEVKKEKKENEISDKKEVIKKYLEGEKYKQEQK